MRAGHGGSLVGRFMYAHRPKVMAANTAATRIPETNFIGTVYL
jgi:hypothetical protein